MLIVDRPRYLDFLNRHKDKEIIKVISGVRRSGKSVLLNLFKKDLLNKGIKENQIISINFEDLSFFELRDFKKLNSYIEDRLIEGQKSYIFLDEIQHVDKFELVIDSLFIKGGLDIYITGSNALFMSGELATNLTGRYVELEVLPLSFSEFIYGKADLKDKEVLFNEYIFSGFPYLLRTESYIEAIEYLRGIYSTVLLNDIVARIGNPDPNLIERIIRCLLSSIGSLVSTNKIKNTLMSQNISLSYTSLENYLSSLTSSLLFYSVPRFDIKGRELLKRFEKYYAVDMGFRNLLIPDHREDLGHIIENIVYLELRRRYFKVYVGNLGKYEVDFVAVRERGEYSYFQVALSTLDEDTLERELRPLREIKDHYPKILLTLDKIRPSANYNGIMKKNLIDWLLEK